MTSEIRNAELMRASLMAATAQCMRRAGMVVAAALVVMSATAGAQDAAGDGGATRAVPSRPRIGLVLSGGGARGPTHIGVLEMLDQLHVPIDVIAGTSMGAVVGGLYASGMSGEQIKHALSSLDWQAAFRDRPPRTALASRRQEGDREDL